MLHAGNMPTANSTVLRQGKLPVKVPWAVRLWELQSEPRQARPLTAAVAQR